MALSLRLYDETSSISFTSEQISLSGVDASSSWFMASNKVDVQSLVPYSTINGPVITERTRNLLSENIPLWLSGFTTYVELKENINIIEILIEKANNGREVWVEYTDQLGTDSTWRSPVMAGVFGMTNETLFNLRENKAFMLASLTRQPWWEGVEQDVNMSGNIIANGSPISILETNEEGVMETPIKMTLTKITGAASAGARVYMFQKHNTESTRQNYNIGLTSSLIFGNSNLETATTASVLNIGNLSEGWYRVWLGGLAASSMETLRESSVWRWGLGNSSTYTITGPWVSSGRVGSHQSRYTDLGSIYVGQSSHVHIQSLATKGHSSASQPVYVLPTNNYREFYFSGSFSNTDTVIDDGIGKDVGGSMAGVAQGHGQTPMLVPRENSELVILAEDASGNISSTYSIAAKYRPRRNTI